MAASMRRAESLAVHRPHMSGEPIRRRPPSSAGRTIACKLESGRRLCPVELWCHVGFSGIRFAVRRQIRSRVFSSSPSLRRRRVLFLNLCGVGRNQSEGRRRSKLVVRALASNCLCKIEEGSASWGGLPLGPLIKQTPRALCAFEAANHRTALSRLGVATRKLIHTSRFVFLFGNRPAWRFRMQPFSAKPYRNVGSDKRKCFQ